ncbi:MAG: aminopeptidase P N-terminal domain-containing protein [Gemmatimonadota bacterium]
MRTFVFCAMVILAEPLVPGGLMAQEVPKIGADEYAARRDRVLDQVSDGILLLHARTAPKEMEQWGFIQDPSFLYFTGLAELPGAILALDGPRRETRLFVPPPPASFGGAVQGLIPAPGMASARRLGIDAVEPWDDFIEWVDARITDGVGTLYVDEPRRPAATGVPEGLAPVAGPQGLWRAALETRWPNVEVASGRPAIGALRWVKSPTEAAILERNARSTATALLAVARTLRPGLRQREAEATVVAACIASGAQGPSFWPWVMSGPNTHMGQLDAAFFRYEHLDRPMVEGELVRVDLGCGGGLYGGDVGRTMPVSGRFSDGQREAWNLLIDGYRAGMEAMSAGVTLDAVREASRARVAEARPGLTTALGREAAATIVERRDMLWHIHGVGIESGEAAGPVLEAGSVVAFEPMLTVGDDVFYLEDMILITPTGHRVLSAGLPYTAEEIEAAMASGG